jgi:hypothetical protein
MRYSRGGTTPGAGEQETDLVPELFDSRAERAPSSGQSSAAAVVGGALLILELLAAPLVLVVTLATSLVTWWLLDSPWAGRRRHQHRRGINSRLLYLSTLMLLGLWLAVMFIFRASDPALSSGFTTTLPLMIWGVDVTLLQRLNGMESLAQPQGALPVGVEDGFAPFSLFVHGTASTVSISLLAYAMSSARRRLRRRLRERGILSPREPRQPSVPPTVR